LHGSVLSRFGASGNPGAVHRDHSSSCTGSRWLPNRSRFRCLDWVDPTRAFQRRKRTDRFDLKARKPATANATCRWSDVDPQARSSWPPGITMDSGHDVAPPVQGCRCRTRKQDRAHYLGSSRSWRYLSGSEDDRPGLDIRAFRPTSRRERQGANCDDPTGRHPEANQTEKSQAHESARS
ncbi:hypothetical protein FB001_1451, partial [Ensifer sp. SEMIA 135]